MFILNLELLPPVSQLRSDRKLAALLQQLCGQAGGKPSELAVLQDYEHYRFRTDDLQQALQSWSIDTQGVGLSKVASRSGDQAATQTEGQPLDMLIRLAEQHLEFTGTAIEVRHDQLVNYQRLIAFIDPAWLQAVVMARYLRDGSLNLEQMRVWIKGQHPLGYASTSLTERPYADNHVHLGGISGSEIALIEFQFEQVGRDFTEKSTGSLPREFSLLSSGRLEVTDMPWLLHSLGDLLQGLLLADDKEPEPDQVTQAAQQAFGGFPFSITARQSSNLRGYLSLLRPCCPVSGLLSLAVELYDQSQHGKAWLLFTTAMVLGVMGKEGTEKAQLLPLLHAYICTANVLRALMVMRGVGLTEFIDFFRRSLRSDKQLTATKNRDLLVTSHGSILHAAKTGPLTRSRLHQGFAQAMQRNGGLAYDQQHFCVHFSRGYEKNKVPDSFLARNKARDKSRRAVRKAAEKQVKLWSRADIRSHSTGLLLSGDKHSRYDLAQWLRGLDVAGNENHHPIEVFAPVLRWLRQQGWQKTSFIWQKLRKPFLSVHAGEDFTHLLTGMRRIDETVRFCDMTSGDRLGHALALGLNPKRWAQRQASFYLTRGEYLDNLVWCHHYALELTPHYPQAHAMASWLERSIQQQADKLYSGLAWTTELLFEAWRLRRNCPLSFQWDKKARGLMQAGEIGLWLPDFVVGPRQPSDEAIALWKRYACADWLDQQTKDGLRFDESLLFVYDDNARYRDDESVVVITPQELELYEMIQDYLMTRYDYKGIVIEACPSSNVYIAQLEGYHEHPVFRWFPPKTSTLKKGKKHNRFGIRNGPVKVCVNTDDPGVFPTDLPNEHRALKEAACQYHGACQEDAERWSERLRQIGVEAFEQQRCSLESVL